MATFKEDPAAYMRAYRARKRGLPSTPIGGALVVDKALSRGAIEKASGGEIASIRAKVATIGPGAVITSTPHPVGGKLRLDVVPRQAFEARQKPVSNAIAPRPAPAMVPPSAKPSLPTSQSPDPYRPPKSMLAIGGKPGRGLVSQGRGYPAPPDIAATSNYGQFMSRTETMLAALAAKSDEQERRIATLEAEAADRQARAMAVANALAGLFQFAIRR